MPDDNAAPILAPNDPTWNPPTAGTGTMLDVPPPVSTSMNVSTPPPAPMELAQQPQLTNPVAYPEQPPLPHPEQHHSMMGNILDKVATILGGDETYRVHKDEQGRVTVESDPSTRSEKWGRVAAAALGGAFKGLAAGQGPGGAARAVAAGGEFGMQMPQQAQQRAEQQATAEQKRQAFNASNAMLNQEVARRTFDFQQAKQKVDIEDAKRFNEIAQHLEGAPGVGDLGLVKNPTDLYALKRSNPDLFKNHGDGVIEAHPEYDGKGNLLGFHGYVVDRAWQDQLNTDPVTTYQMIPPAKLGDPPQLKPVTIPRRGITNGDLGRVNQKVSSDYLKAVKDVADAQKATAEKIPTTSEQAMAMAEVEIDPTRKAQLEAAAKRMAAEEEKQKTLGRASTTITPGIVPAGTQIGDLIKPGGAFAPGTVNGTNAQKLATGDMEEKDLPGRNVKGYATKQEYTAAAEAYSQQLYGLGYSPVEIAQERKFFENMKSQGAMKGIDKMIGTPTEQGYIDTVIDLAQRAGINNTAAPLNKVKQRIKEVLGDPAANTFDTSLGELQRGLPQLIGNPLLGGADSDLKLKQAKDMFAAHPTLATLRSQGEILKTMMTTSRAGYMKQNRYFQREYGAQGPYTKQFSSTHESGTMPTSTTPPPAAGNTQQAAVQAPAGATMEYKDAQGNVTGWAVNGQYVARK